ncbi:unnamed protein product [Didymodactylos carnosus]|uniref:Cadherin domain-containing protein n=1 Tax=Didymodactylos carnosus TaxID=1234261 RepID=A0A814V1X6_9BILA|nr:unnamed protein product [Didymodactylos carnosus]CAF3948339.1 unnamed protein product [Didymodactylos carnosus]
MSVSESTAIGTTLLRVRAYLVDNSFNSQISYSLRGDETITNKFQLDKYDGKLILKSMLDFETTSLYIFTIDAKVESMLPSFVEVTIYVINVNDNPPDLNVLFYPSVSIQQPSNIATILYDSSASYTPICTINVKDKDYLSTSTIVPINLTVHLNNTDEFQLQLVRLGGPRSGGEATYILSTINTKQLTKHNLIYLSIDVCDNDEPPLWTNRSFVFHLIQKSSDDCNILFDKQEYLIDINETTPLNTLLLRTYETNCQNSNTQFNLKNENISFHIDHRTGELFTSKYFNRTIQSIYQFQILANDQQHQTLANITIRILDNNNHRPFIMDKKVLLFNYVTLQKNQFLSNLNIINFSNSTGCKLNHENYYFQLLSNCSVKLLPNRIPIPGKYYLSVKLDQIFQDTFLIEIIETKQSELLSNVNNYLKSQWIIILAAILAFIFVLSTMLLMIHLFRRKHKQKILNKMNEQLDSTKQHPLDKCINEIKKKQKLSEAIGTHHNSKYETVKNKLQVHDDQQLSNNSDDNLKSCATIYLLQRTSTQQRISPSSHSSSSGNDIQTCTTSVRLDFDEGYAGSSELELSDGGSTVSPMKWINKTRNIEQYQVYEFQQQQKQMIDIKRINLSATHDESSVQQHLKNDDYMRKNGVLQSNSRSKNVSLVNASISSHISLV